MNWLSGTHKMPYWVPELIRLQNMEHAEMMRQMGMQALPKRLGKVTQTGTVLAFKPREIDTPADIQQTIEMTTATQSA